MKIIKKMIKAMSWFEWFEVLGVTAFTVYFATKAISGNPLWYVLLDSTAAICGILCVVLCAAGKRSQYFWGFINILAYVVIAYYNKYYGEVMLNGLYYLPSQFIGMWLWKKHKDQKDESLVKCKKLKISSTIVMLVISGISIFLYKIILEKLGGTAPWLDSTSTCFSVIANVLMLLRYREQWILWIIVDAVTVVMWIVKFDPIMTVMWSFYLLNAIYGLMSWTKKRNRSNQTNE